MKEGAIIQDVKEVVYLKSKDGGDNSMPLKGFWGKVYFPKVIRLIFVMAVSFQLSIKLPLGTSYKLPRAKALWLVRKRSIKPTIE